MPAHVPHRPGPWIPRSFQTADNPVVVTVYEDVVTGTITLSGAITESWRASDSPSGTVTLFRLGYLHPRFHRLRIRGHHALGFAHRTPEPVGLPKRHRRPLGVEL
jgi:hypothetical protein